MVVRSKADDGSHDLPKAGVSHSHLRAVLRATFTLNDHGRRLHSDMLTQYLFVFAQVHDEFRIPELLSVAELYGFEVKFSENPEDRDTSRPFMILELESEEHARMLAGRCILIK